MNAGTDANVFFRPAFRSIGQAPPRVQHRSDAVRKVYTQGRALPATQRTVGPFLLVLCSLTSSFPRTWLARMHTAESSWRAASFVQNLHDSSDGTPDNVPAGLTQHMLNNVTMTPPPCRITQVDVLQALEVEEITGHQSVRRRRGRVIAVGQVRGAFYETLSPISGARNESPGLSPAIFYLLGRHAGLAPPAVDNCLYYYAGCESALHNGNFLEVTAGIFWHPAAAASRIRTELISTALEYGAATLVPPNRVHFGYKGDNGFDG